MNKKTKYQHHNSDTWKVLYVNLEGSMAGAEQSLLLIVRFMPKTIQISAACPSGPLTEKLNSLGIKTYRISSPPRKFNLSAVWLFYLAIVNIQLFVLIFKVRPQIIHANGTKAVLAATLAKVLTPAKLIWHMRDLRCAKWQVKICGCLSSKVIAVSRAVKIRLTKLGVKPKLIEVIYNGIDPDSIKISKKNQSEPVTFANIGQFVPWKKQLIFIEAAEKYLQQGGKANFLLIGDDLFGRDSKYKQQLISRINTSPFAPNIRAIGWQNNLNPLWSKVDCLIHTADAEPFGRVIIEAMAHNITVIAAEVAGPAEIIDNGRTGFLFDPDDIDGLIAAMKTVSENRQLAHKLALNGRRDVISSFTAGKTAEEITRVYKELLAA